MIGEKQQFFFIFQVSIFSFFYPISLNSVGDTSDRHWFDGLCQDIKINVRKTYISTKIYGRKNSSWSIIFSLFLKSALRRTDTSVIVVKEKLWKLSKGGMKDGEEKQLFVPSWCPPAPQLPSPYYSTFYGNSFLGATFLHTMMLMMIALPFVVDSDLKKNIIYYNFLVFWPIFLLQYLFIWL